MRIGIITGEYPPMQGGVGAYSRVLALTLAGQGHDVFIFSTAGTQESDPNLELTVSPKRRWGYATLNRVRRWAHNKHLDVVNLQYQTAAYTMSGWIHFMPEAIGDIPVVTTFHDLLYPYLFPKAGELRLWIVRRLAHASAGVIVTNQEDLTQLEDHPTIQMIPIGSNIDPTLPPGFDVHGWQRQVGIEGGQDMLLVHFGFINRSKGLETLLHALAQLRRQGIDIKLVMLGGRTGSSDPTNVAYADEIDTLILDLDLYDHVYWTGFVEDYEVSLYLKSGVVVLPFRDGASYRRGSLMAAIQHGCTIITTEPTVDVPAFKHEENMLLVPVGDTVALAGAIRRVYIDGDLAADLSEGADHLARQFDWGTIAQTCVSLYKTAVRNGD
jgi:glycosyltransferase involved in cell wall biosynthesis